MPRLVTTLLVLLVATSLLGCHARFKREAPALGAVKTQAFAPAYPDVELGKIYDDNLVAIVFDAYQTGREYDVERHIQSAVDAEGISYALQEGVADALRDGPPFAYTDQRDAPAVLQMEVRDWGLEVPHLGARGDLNYVLRVRIYRDDGQVVYKSRVRCELPAGDPTAASVGFVMVDNARQIEQMSPEELQAAFEGMARYCGTEVVRKMRRHAG